MSFSDHAYIAAAEEWDESDAKRANALDRVFDECDIDTLPNSIQRAIILMASWKDTTETCAHALEVIGPRDLHDYVIDAIVDWNDGSSHDLLARDHWIENEMQSRAEHAQERLNERMGERGYIDGVAW